MTETSVTQLPSSSTAYIAGQDAFDFVQQNYPQEAWMLQVPELAGVIISVAEQGITDQTTIQSMIEATQWWQNNSDAARTFIEQEMTDPATAQANLAAQEASIQATFAQLGLNPSQDQVNSFAYESLMNGWTTQQLMNAIGHSIQVNSDGSFQVATYYIDPQTGKEVDVFTGQEAYYGPQGEPATPTKPSDMTGWASWTQPDGTVVYYKPGTAMGVMTGANGAITGIGAVATSAGQQYAGLSNVATLQNGRYIDNRSGLPAYYGPDGEPGYPTQQAALNGNPGAQVTSATMPDGTVVWYVPNNYNYTGGGTATPFAEGQGGTLQSTQQQLEQLAKQFMVNVSPQTLGQWSEQIAAGQTTQQGFQSYLQQTALGQFPWMQQGIESGQTPMQLVNPYANMVSSELGISPNDIDWTQPQWASLLTSTDPTTGSLSQKPLYQATQELRTNPAYGWQNTPNAQAAAYSFIQGLQQTMGFADYGGNSISTPGQYGSSGG